MRTLDPRSNRESLQAAFQRAAQRVADLDRSRPAHPGIVWLAEYRAAKRNLDRSQPDMRREGLDLGDSEAGAHADDR